MTGTDSWTIARVLAFAAEDFGRRGLARPRFEAEVLLAATLGLDRLRLYTDFDRPLGVDELGRYREAIRRRRAGVPAAYITGHREFWSLDFLVDERVLVPRPETELLVAEVLATASPTGPFAELCTGSGCVACALAEERPEALVDATDLSPGAVTVARENAARLGLAARVTVYEGDLDGPLPAGRRYAALVGNPPYVPTAELASLPPEVQAEPRLALDGGPDGLDPIRRILALAPDRLLPGGVLALELDPRQAPIVAGELGRRALGVEGVIHRDLAGLARVVVFKTRADRW